MLISCLLLFFLDNLFLDSFGHELRFSDGEVNDYGSPFESCLVKFFDNFLAWPVACKLDEGKAFVAFLVIRIKRDLNIYYLPVRFKQFPKVFFSNIKDNVPDDKSIFLP